MRSVPAILLAACLLGAPGARAQTDDAPIPYPGDEDNGPRKLPGRSDPTFQHHEAQVEEEERVKPLQRFDDANRGLAAELFAGVMLLESSRGAGVEPVFSGGARGTWELGRFFFEDETLHEGLFVDLTWAYAQLNGGTTAIHEESTYHYFSLAPAFEYPFGHKAWFGAYAQLGGGLSYESDTLHAGNGPTSISAVKPVIQYGIGLRGRPPLNDEGTVRLAFRIELTRFHRGYVDDTFLGGSAGLDF